MLDTGQWKVLLQPAVDPGLLMPLVLHVLAKPLFHLVVVMMLNFPESAHIVQELSILLLMLLSHAKVKVLRICRRSLSC